jgi:hypothetical protein
MMSPTMTPAYPNNGGNMPGMGRMPDMGDPRNPRPMDRTPMGSPGPMDMRNSRPRPQSPHPPPMSRSPMSYQQSGPPTGPGMESVLGPQQDTWANSRQYEQPRPPPPRPSSFAQTRQSGEQPRPFVPNGSAHPPMQLRQRS